MLDINLLYTIVVILSPNISAMISICKKPGNIGWFGKCALNTGCSLFASFIVTCSGLVFITV